MQNLDDIVYVNGEFLRARDAKISIFDRGFIFGDGIYEVVPVINSKLIDKSDFWDRFCSSLEKIEINLEINKQEIENIAYELIYKNNIKEGAVYIQVTRGEAFRNFIFLENLKPTIVAFVYKTEILNHPKLQTGIKMISTPDLRWKRRDIKSISLLAQCMAKTYAYKAGVDECLMIENGFVTECGSSSAFIIKNGVLLTKPLSNEILPGIRRKIILNLAEKLGLEVRLREFDLDEVYRADEVFISAATLLILPVISVDEKLINGGKIGKFTVKLRELYVDKIKTEVGF
ncbi:D-amino acid aminotransferase [Campylobacter sp. FMV-PI01]|uniref:branched-chain-amino-acid transaminase n=1 Tax=Campylobacter portucalensis TaxID=2608384 RepID=A0A6L5WGH5_9BACT|nr:D-amino acid aminotransferase [Campylobacter portucalensis]MSN96278.1 D-amino acid aminotransferase [Campylobacter portucalensis]